MTTTRSKKVLAKTQKLKPKTTATNTVEKDGRKTVNHDRVLELHAQGVKPVHIANACNCSLSSVYQVLKQYAADEPEAVKTYEAGRKGILQNLQRRLLGSLTDEEIKEMKPKDRIVSAAVLMDKEAQFDPKGQQNQVLIIQQIVNRAAEIGRDSSRAFAFKTNGQKGQAPEITSFSCPAEDS